MIAQSQRIAEPGLSKKRLRLWLDLLRSTRHVEGRLRDLLRDQSGTTLPRFDVMAVLYREETGLRMSDLSRRLMVSNGNVTGIVDRLVTDGMIVRVPVAGDRRATLVRLTARGRAVFAEMAAQHEEWVNDLFSGLPAAEIDALTASLAKIRTNRELDR